MANDIASLIPTLFSAFRRVPRELTGFVNSVTTSFDDKGVALGNSVDVPVVVQGAESTTVNGPTWPTGDDTTVGTRQLTLTEAKTYSWNFEAEEERTMMNGSNRDDVVGQILMQGVRTMVNTAEAFMHDIAYKASSRAVGVAGTTPFGSDISDAALIKQVLDDNGAPSGGNRSLIINTNAGVNLRSLTQLTNVNESGTPAALREGELLRLFDISIKESAGVSLHTKGTGTGYLVNNGAGILVGGETIANDTGTGTLLAGDIVTFAADTTNKYVSNTTLAAGTFDIGAPGIRDQTIPDDNAISIGNSYIPNVAFDQSALVFSARPALQPDSGAWESQIITDPQTGLSMLFTRVPQKGQVSWFLEWVYGGFAPNKEFICTLMG